MKGTGAFIELVKSLCLRRHMYVSGETFDEVCAYLTGYAFGSPDCPLSGEGWSAFNSFVCATFRFPGKYAWPYVVKQCSRDDDEAAARLQSLLTDFAEQTESKSYQEILHEVMERTRGEEEGEQVRAKAE